MAHPEAVLEKVNRMESYWLEHMSRQPDRADPFWRLALQYSEGIIRQAIEITGKKVKKEQQAGAPMHMKRATRYALAVMRYSESGQQIVLTAGSSSYKPYHVGRQRGESREHGLNWWRRKLFNLQRNLKHCSPKKRAHFTRKVKRAEENILRLEQDLSKGAFARMSPAAGLDFDYGYLRCSVEPCSQANPNDGKITCGKSKGHKGYCSWEQGRNDA